MVAAYGDFGHQAAADQDEGGDAAFVAGCRGLASGGGDGGCLGGEFEVFALEGGQCSRSSKNITWL